MHVSVVSVVGTLRFIPRVMPNACIGSPRSMRASFYTVSKTNACIISLSGTMHLFMNLQLKKSMESYMN